MSDDRADYYDEILNQLSSIIADGGGRNRIKTHLERHGYDCSVKGSPERERTNEADNL